MRDPSEEERGREIVRLRLELQQSRQNWNLTFDAVSDWVSIVDPGFRITQTNRAAETVLGIPRESIIGRCCYEVAHGSDRPVNGCPVAITFSTRKRSQAEIELKNGRWVLVSADPIFGNDGDLIGAIHIARDISKRKAVEKSLRENEERLAFTAKAGNLGLWDWHADVRRLFTNSQFLSATGLEESEVRDFSLDDWLKNVHPKDRERCRETLSAYLDGRREHPEIVLRFWNVKKLKWVWLYLSGRVIGLRASTVPGRAVGILQDITRRKEREEEREGLIEKLSKALSEVKTLSGLLPICSHCKKIRDDRGYWNQIEGYIRQHSNAEFSHGICPECAKRLYPGYDLY